MRTLAEYPTENGPHWLVEFKNLDEQLRKLRSWVTQFRAHPVIRALALKIIHEAGSPMRDKKAQAIAIGRWVRENIYYVHELPERFQTPLETLRKKSGDCDDFTTLTGALLESIGIPSVMVVMEVNGKWAHIFPAARGRLGLIPLDGTNKFDIDVNPVTHAISLGKAVRLKLA